MRRRDALQQGEPDSVDRAFPSCELGTVTLFRAHTLMPEQSDGGCWFYASLAAPQGRIGGRFDLTHPRGTCYWASAEIAAARERVGRPCSLVALDEVEGAVVSASEVTPGRTADLLDPVASMRGVTQELAASAPYGLAQRWAAAFDGAGFDGIRYQPRFTTERAEAVACFGTSGRPVTIQPVSSRRTVADVLRDNGYTVLDTPSSHDLSPLLD